MSARVRHTTSRSASRRHGHRQEAEEDSGTPRRSTRPYDYASAVSPSRRPQDDMVRDRNGSALRHPRGTGTKSPGPAVSAPYYPGDAALRRQSTQRPGGPRRDGSIDPGQYRRPSPVRRSRAVASPARSPRREREVAVGEARPASRHRPHRGEDPAPLEEPRTSSRRQHRSRSRPDSAVRPQRTEHVEASRSHRHESRHRSRSRKTREEGSDRHRSRSRRPDSARPHREKEHAAESNVQRAPHHTARQDTGRYVSPPDAHGFQTTATTTTTSGRHSARHHGATHSPAAPPIPQPPARAHHTDPARPSSSRPPAPRPAHESFSGGSRALAPPSLSSPQRQRSGSHIEVLSVSSLHGPGLPSLGGAGSDVYGHTPLAAPGSRRHGSRPYVSPSPNQPADIIEDRIEETREWVAAVKQEVARSRAMEQAEAAIAAADVNRFLAGLRRADSITAPSEMDEPLRLNWGAYTEGRRERTRPAQAGFHAAPHTPALDTATPERRRQSARRRERERELDAVGSSRTAAETREAPQPRSRSSAKKKSRSHRVESGDDDDNTNGAPRARHSSTRRRRVRQDTSAPSPSEDSLTPGRATSAHPPPPGVPASRTSSQAAWLSTPRPLEIVSDKQEDRSVDKAVVDMSSHASPASTIEVASKHTRRSGQRTPMPVEPAPAVRELQDEGEAAAPPKRSKKSSSRLKPPPTPSDVATTASEDALETDASPTPKPASVGPAPSASGASGASSNATEDLVAEGEAEDVYFMSFLDGSRFLSTDELCQYNVFMAESLSDANLDLLREVVFNQDDVLFAEVLYGDDIQAELAQIDALQRDAAARNRRPLAEVEDEIWEDQKAAIQRFNNKAAVALESVQNCGTDFVEALESAAIAFREQQLQSNNS